ncbi:hypothetical protein LTR53_003542 [Teratosphaeriaceae sp. CCFEE 6253]|nr:hypothetical protein LTR53_003542 [Teratosphaeriaceae sp. CCFEE 6253]
MGDIVSASTEICGLGHGLLGLHSDKSTLRLALISSLRSRGIGEHIDLPQLVVCGDQSAGKSSGLEGITGMPFPRQDGLCTRFATEITLEHADTALHITASIIPAASSDERVTGNLRAYSRNLTDFKELPLVIAEVGELMGLRGYGTISSGPSFGKDVLRIKVCENTGLHLSVVDLPGIIQTPNDEQDDNDVEVVDALVDAYAANPRNIILAVVQAGNDISNQPIVQKSKKFDKAGERTIGVITKPDLVNRGSQGRIALLARDEDKTRLKLGVFIVKNPSPSELAEGISLEEREEAEARYFSSPPWKEQGLAQDRVGISALRAFLQNLLDRHTERELPKVRDELRVLLKSTERDITNLGEERPTVTHIRCSYLGYSKIGKLRAYIHAVNPQFSDNMRNQGQTLSVATNTADAIEDASDLEGLMEDSEHLDQILVTEVEFKAWIKKVAPVSTDLCVALTYPPKVYSTSRGRELPGNYNHVLLAELYHFQSRRWKDMASKHLGAVHTQPESFIQTLAQHVTQDERISMEIADKVAQHLSGQMIRASAELEVLIEDERQQPITYNHYYTDNVQRARQGDS